jgi:hypothetical protein
VAGRKCRWTVAGCEFCPCLCWGSLGECVLTIFIIFGKGDFPVVRGPFMAVILVFQK